jgi:hypothetical protein
MIAWEECIELRQNMGFCLGTLDTLTHDKIQLVQDNWQDIRGIFPQELARYAAEEDIPLPLTDLVND